MILRHIFSIGDDVFVTLPFVNPIFKRFGTVVETLSNGNAIVDFDGHRISFAPGDPGVTLIKGQN